MKVQVRQGVFETNSSSSHSITISTEKNALYDTIIPDADGVLHLSAGGYNFGWGYEEYTTPHAKLDYCLSDLENVRDPLVRLNYLAMLHTMLLEHTGAKSICHDHGTEGYSEIDHQSVGTAIESAFVSEQTLKDFIFNPKSILIIDNDNH